MKFMVSFHVRSEDMAEIMPLLPQEEARSKELREQGVVEALSISSDHLSGH